MSVHLVFVTLAACAIPPVFAADPPDARFIDLSNKTVMPGLIDTHTHVTGDPTTPPYHGYGISIPREALKGARVGLQQYTPEEVAAIVDEAHMHGRRVAVHAHGANGIKVALKAGVDTIEHASLIDEEGLKLAQKNGAFLSMDIYNTEYTQTEGPRRGELEEFLRKDREVAQAQRDNFRKAVQMGIKLTMGTDTGVHPHKDAPKQLATMVQYGMTPMQAIQAATKVGAEALGIEAEVGQIAPGYSADIVAVTRDPLADIHALDAVEFVMKQGSVYKQ